MCPVFPFDLAGDPGLNRSTINLRKTGKTRAAMEAIAVKVAFALCLVADKGPLARAQETSGASALEVATVRVDARPKAPIELLRSGSVSGQFDRCPVPQRN